METEIFAKLPHTPPRFYLDTKVRVREALGRWNRRLHRARVFLHEETRGRDGLGTRCRLVLEGAHGFSLVTTGRAGDVEGALHDALKRAHLRVRRREDEPVPFRTIGAGPGHFGEAA